MGLATVFDCQDVLVFDHIKVTQVKLDVLCRQQIKLFQVVSTSEFHED